MLLTVFEIDNAKPGLRPIRQSEEGKKDKRSPSKVQEETIGMIPGEKDKSAKNSSEPKCVKTEKPYKLSDGGGLYVEADPSGGKYWRLKYRFPKENRISFGAYPDVNLAKAREERDNCCSLLSEGIDPGVTRKAQKVVRVGNAAKSFEIVAREWLKTYVDSKAESHRKRVCARFENDIFHTWVAVPSRKSRLCRVNDLASRGFRPTRAPRVPGQTPR